MDMGALKFRDRSKDLLENEEVKLSYLADRREENGE